ncbi:MAG: carbohydrate binding domain-containing protein, partial [Armatimonadetes bacterium]|nr:carbohydrate binding domain-containing protein [Armatimonadota bacterium]
MLRELVLAILLVAASVVGAAVQPGENILINGTFESLGQAFPSFWDKGGSNTSASPTGGPGKTGAVIFSNPDGQKGVSSTCRQYDQKIIAGETYKMSADVKTQGFKSAHCGVIVIDNGWYKEYGLKSFPENTDGWQHLEQTFTLGESKNGVYGVAIFAINYVGEIQFAQVKLEALSAG